MSEEPLIPSEDHEFKGGTRILATNVTLEYLYSTKGAKPLGPEWDELYGSRNIGWVFVPNLGEEGEIAKQQPLQQIGVAATTLEGERHAVEGPLPQPEAPPPPKGLKARLKAEQDRRARGF